MRISVFGLGYVGAVTAACLARDGHDVTGVDVSDEKVEMLNDGRAPIVEPGLAELLKRVTLKATTDPNPPVAQTSISVVSVGTPQAENGSPDLTQVKDVCRQIGRAVAAKGKPHIVVLRSTAPPGTMAKCETWLNEESNGTQIHVAQNPEFLREGSALEDYDKPPFIVIGTRDRVAEHAVRQMYQHIDAPVIVAEPETTEMVKYVCNAWHAAKITFANEVGRLAKAVGVSGHDVMQIVTRDKKLNLSKAYMAPGFAYGGSCLPKDLAALIHQAKRFDVPTPMLESIPRCNDQQIDAAERLILSHRAHRIAVMGLAFKPKTDDLRLSPAVPLVKRLIGEGRQVKIFDQYVHESSLLGANKRYIRNNLPHFEALLTEDAAKTIQWAELVILTYADPSIDNALAEHAANKPVIDLNNALCEPLEQNDRTANTQTGPHTRREPARSI